MRLWNSALAAALAASLLGGAMAAELTPHSMTAQAHPAGKHTSGAIKVYDKLGFAHRNGVLTAAVSSLCHHKLCAYPHTSAKKAAKGKTGGPPPVAAHAAAPVKGRPGVASTASGGQGGAPSIWDPNEMRRLNQSSDLSDQGDAEAKSGDWQAAISHYQQAIHIWPENSTALYGLGRYADAAGDTARAIQYYRVGIYAGNPSQGSDGWREGNVAPLMEYAILLSKAGQEQEALAVYRHTVAGLNSEDGKPNLDVLLPDFGPGDRSYTPRMLQAMAHVAVAYETEEVNKARALSHLEQAVALAPASPIPYFYRGQFAIFHGDYKGAPAYYAQAAQRGDAQVGAAVEKAMKIIR